MIAPLAPTLPPLGAGAHCDASALPKLENFSTIVYRQYCIIAIGGCHSGGGMLACQKERQNYSKDFYRANNSLFFKILHRKFSFDERDVP